MNTERFVEALRECNLNPTEIADILWLSLRQLLARSEPTPGKVERNGSVRQESRNEAGNSTDNRKSGSTEEKADDTTLKKTDDTPFDIAAQTSTGTLLHKALPISVPDAGFLDETLPLVRALRPLLKRLNSTTVSRVNEAATVDFIAETDIWSPVMQADREPWFEVALVIDSSAAMTLWQRLIEDIHRLLRCYGSFRDFRTWELVYMDGQMGLQVTPDRSIRSPKELLAPDGRRLTIVFTDCTADYWWNGALQTVLALWGGSMPTVIWQVLPDWMWKRTALGVGEYVAIRNRIPGAKNKELKPTFLSLRPPRQLQARRTGDQSSALAAASGSPICLPVITTDGESIAAWSSMVAGDRRQVTPGFVLLQSDWERFRNRPASDSGQLLEQFRLRATPAARRLAALLSAAPVINLPIMRLIRASMLPGSSPLPVAEVFLSGLLQRATDQPNTTNPELVQYSFPAETRNRLLDILPLVEAIAVIEAVSQHVAERLNCTLADFRALLLSPDLQLETAQYGLRTFARVTAQILRKLGGDYAALADRFESPGTRRGRMASQIRIFIASSVEGKKYAEYIGRILSSYTERDIVTLPWWDRTWFPPNSTAIESLENITGWVDAAILIGTPDDKTTQRGDKTFTPSSNVILEYAFFQGRLGRLQSAIALVEGAHLPSDLAGVDYISLPLMQGSSTDISNDLLRAGSPVLDWLNQLSKALDLREGISNHLQAVYNRSNGRLRVIIPSLRGGTGSEPGLVSANNSRITTMATIEGLAFGWLLKALSPMMSSNERIECLTPSPEQMFTQGSATFLIGSPSTNEQIKSIIARWYHTDMTIEETQDYSDIITYKGEKFETQFVNGLRTRDYSFLTYRSKYELFVCTGTSPFGAAGAVSMLTEPHGGQKIETIHEYIHKRQSFVAIGEVEINSEMHWGFKSVLRVVNGAGDSE